jgi:hypothetical protein
MKFIAWLALIGLEVTAISCFALIPNEFYNRPSVLSQYAGYARNISPAAIPVTLFFFGLNLNEAKRKRTQVRAYCPNHLLAQLDSISLTRFLSIDQRKINKAIEGQYLLKNQNFSSEDYVMNVLLGMYDED